jgi:phosphohistidine phosphatase
MTELYLLRHAHAGDPHKWQGDDSERPLSDKGRRQSERLGRLLSQTGFVPGPIVSSPKLRARETAEIVARLLGTEATTDERLAGGLDLERLESVLGDLDAERPMLVGHDPDFSELVADLCGTDGVPLRKGALCRIDLERPLAAGRGVLRWLIPPDLLKGSD